MKGYLTNNQIQYVLFHLNQNVELNDQIKSHLLFNKDWAHSKNHSGKIIFNLSKEAFDLEKIIWINHIPHLFPLSSTEKHYTIENNTLIFHHDILKSCFFLLSGYQEYKNTNKDHFNRFKYNGSVQEKLGIVHKPIVNYYFEIIEQAFHDFFKLNNIPVKKKKLFQNFCFFLTHDIDNIDYYTINRLLYKIKELTGLVKSNYSFKTNVRHILKTSIEILKFSKKQNPDWNFSYLRAVEKKYSFRSSFYFLEKDKKHHDSRYSFTEERVVKLFNQLSDEKCEICLHGTVGSYNNELKLKKTLQNLSRVSPQEVRGIRQHRLMYEVPLTAILHEKNNLIYDTTLCFAEHEGFRNSYCLPFKLFDFEDDRIINMWEIPLNAMDVTLFYYRSLNNNDAQKAIDKIIQEVKRFNGVFTLLWHNDFFDEERYPEIKSFYENLIDYINTLNPSNHTGNEIIDQCSKS